MCFHHGLSHGLVLTFLLWSFFILCLPGNHGSMILGAPMKAFFNIRVNAQVWVWIAAVVFNFAVYRINKDIYLENFITHLLRYIVSSPYPDWLVIIFATVTNFYKPMFRYNFHSKFYFFHAAVHTLLIIVTLLAFYWWIYPEAIFLFNFST